MRNKCSSNIIARLLTYHIIGTIDPGQRASCQGGRKIEDHLKTCGSCKNEISETIEKLSMILDCAGKLVGS